MKQILFIIIKRKIGPFATMIFGRQYNKGRNKAICSNQQRNLFVNFAHPRRSDLLSVVWCICMVNASIGTYES